MHVMLCPLLPFLEIHSLLEFFFISLAIFSEKSDLLLHCQFFPQYSTEVSKLTTKDKIISRTTFTLVSTFYVIKINAFIYKLI